MNWLTESGYLSRVSLKRKLTIKLKKILKQLLSTLIFWVILKRNSFPSHLIEKKKTNLRHKTLEAPLKQSTDAKLSKLT